MHLLFPNFESCWGYALPSSLCAGIMRARLLCLQTPIEQTLGTVSWQRATSSSERWRVRGWNREGPSVQECTAAKPWVDIKSLYCCPDARRGLTSAHQWRALLLFHLFRRISSLVTLMSWRTGHFDGYLNELVSIRWKNMTKENER